ncbi:SDR family NAD(P)-dependent oxidoreductase [Kutzneria chonburiensis]|uniref:SDR family NAD(P)-dependent oxidoreductase n=1 Tax=Kutzneria chonburiensis TaxID=1483604 RepID=A0ABV6MXE0_9PSEU|nr:SDR family NAD(P)-dependent oxidoreductase [Kutzneria chonburiensis]
MSFDEGSTAMDVIDGHDLRDKVAVVTGGASGLGAATTRALASAGAQLVLAGRNEVKGAAKAAELRAATGNGAIEFGALDLGSLASVAVFVRDFLATGRPLHILVNNAGVMACPLAYTDDGFETQFGTNHLGHFALTTGLLPALRAAGDARVVALSSRAHRRGDIYFDDPNYRRRAYDPWQAYGQSKTAVALFAVGFSHRHEADGITANSVMPGAIMTDLQRHLPHERLVEMGWADENGLVRNKPGWKTPEQGAATSVWAAVAPELAGVGGKYLDNCAIAEPWTKDGDPPNGHYLPYAVDPDHAERLWVLSEKLTAR